MVASILGKFLKKDTTVKRHLLKSVTWRLVGSVDTALLGWWITGHLSFGIKIGGLELFTKIALYFLHERIWHRIHFGMPAIFKRQQQLKTDGNNNLVREAFAIQKQQREVLNGHKGFTIWLTGLSGSGKSTIASATDAWLYQNKYHSYIIDGDNTRMGINSDLNFTREGRQENIRRVAEICKLFNDAGIITIASFIAPFNEDRLQAQSIIGNENFIMVFIDCSIETCTRRDKKGLYKMALEGKIKNFTGVNSPYEKPLNAHVCIKTDTANVDESVAMLTHWLQQHKFS